MPRSTLGESKQAWRKQVEKSDGDICWSAMGEFLSHILWDRLEDPRGALPFENMIALAWWWEQYVESRWVTAWTDIYINAFQ